MALVVEYHEELELDLHDQRIDLLDLWRGTLTPRLLMLLIKDLPATSRTARAINPDGAAIAAWGVTDYLLADLFDITAKTHFKNPEPYPRPAVVVERRNRDNERRRRLIERYEARQTPVKHR